MKSEYWMVTLKKRFHEPGLSGTGRTKTYVTKIHPMDVLRNEGDDGPDQEFAIVFALPIDEKTFERNRNRRYSRSES